MQYRFEKLGLWPEVKFEIEVIESQKRQIPGRCRQILSRQDVPNLRGRLILFKKKRRPSVCFRVMT
jgi:hypothetical protein